MNDTCYWCGARGYHFTGTCDQCRAVKCIPRCDHDGGTRQTCGKCRNYTMDGTFSLGAAYRETCGCDHYGLHWTNAPCPHCGIYGVDGRPGLRVEQPNTQTASTEQLILWLRDARQSIEKVELRSPYSPYVDYTTTDLSLRDKASEIIEEIRRRLEVRIGHSMEQWELYIKQMTSFGVFAGPIEQNEDIAAIEAVMPGLVNRVLKQVHIEAAKLAEQRRIAEEERKAKFWPKKTGRFKRMASAPGDTK